MAVLISGTTSITTGNGAQVTIDRFFASGDLLVTSGAASGINLGVNSSITAGGNLIVHVGDGGDTVNLNHVYLVGDLTITTGAGADTINVNSSSALKATTVETGGGDDNLTLNLSARPASR